MGDEDLQTGKSVGDLGKRGEVSETLSRATRRMADESYTRVPLMRVRSGEEKV